MKATILANELEAADCTILCVEYPAEGRAVFGGYYNRVPFAVGVSLKTGRFKALSGLGEEEHPELEAAIAEAIVLAQVETRTLATSFTTVDVTG